MSDIIQLSLDDAFARGGNRLCYVDPRNGDRCIKVLIPKRSPRAKRAKAVGVKKFRPLSYYDDNLRELKTYQRLEASFGDEIWAHLPRTQGMVATTLGDGIVTDLIRNYDGAISGCLKTKLRATGYDQNFRDAVNQFVEYLRRTGLPSRDLLLHNLVAKDVDASGRFKMYLIDGFGSSDILPLVYWSKSLARRKVERKITRFEAKIEDFLEKYRIPRYS